MTSAPDIAARRQDIDGELERLLGPREEWDGTLLRELFGVL